MGAERHRGDPPRAGRRHSRSGGTHPGRRGFPAPPPTVMAGAGTQPGGEAVGTADHRWVPSGESADSPRRDTAVAVLATTDPTDRAGLLFVCLPPLTPSE